ncbi:MAG: membrane dipeptidase [Bacteroidetes bacterium]|nr:MAG: membrane dipeptidase [Bacteroidota bacterium]
MIFKKIFVFLLPAFLLINAATADDQQLEQQAREIHQRIFTLDSHTDTPLMLGRRGVDLGKRNDPHKGGGKLDFPRMEEGGLDAAFFAVFLGQGESSPEAWEIARERAVTIFGIIHESIEQNYHLAGLALTPEDGYKLRDEGKRAVYLGLENAYPIGEDLSLVEKFYDLGARYITLSHTRNNHFSDSSNDPEGAVHGGLSDMGYQLIEEMNRLGMMVDVSHISDQAFHDVLSVAKAPVIASHSNARAIHDDPRNLDDDMLIALAENGGVVQLCFLYVKQMPANPPRDSARAELRRKYNDFQNLSDEEMEMARTEWYAIDQNFPSELPTVADIIDHLDHIVNLIGIDYVGIGSDFDGGGQLEDCYDVSEMHNLTVEMLRRGYSEEDIEKVWSGNFMRVFRENIAIRNI